MHQKVQPNSREWFLFIYLSFLLYSYFLYIYNGSVLASVFLLKKNVSISHYITAIAIANCLPPTSQPGAYPSAQLRRRETKQSGTRWRSGWGLSWRWRTERSIRTSGRGKAEGWGRSRHLLHNFLATPICLLLSSYLAATRGYCRFFRAPFCFWSAINTKPNHILWLVVDK